MALFINGVGQDTFSMNGVSIDNLYVDGVLVWSSAVEASIPRYELTEALVDASTVDDSANTSPEYNGLLTESDGTTPYEPTALQYPQNGLLELDNGRIMNTQFNVDTYSDTYGLYGIYDADGSTEYKIWALDLNGDTTATLYEGDQDTPLTETGTIDIYFVSDWQITDGRPSWMPPLDVSSYEPIWINFRNSESATALPPGILHIVAARHHWIDPIIDTQNVASDITVAYDTAALGSADYLSLVTGDNSACMCDMQIEGSSYVSDSSVARIDIYLPAGTYDIQIASSSDRGAGLVIGDFTLGSLGTIQLDGSDGVDCGGWTDVVSTGETIQLSYVKDASSTYGQLSGLNIQRTA